VYRNDPEGVPNHARATRTHGAMPIVGDVPRSLRLRVPGGTFHVTARGNRRQDVFRTDDDYRLYLGLLGTAVDRFRLRCFDYCLMPNHIHLVLGTPSGDLSAAIQWLHGTYAGYFNERYELAGHLFQGRFGSELVERTEHRLELVRYLARNPVRAGLCAHPAQWRWSGFGALAGARRRPRFLSVDETLALFAADPCEARRRLAAFVRDAPDAELDRAA